MTTYPIYVLDGPDGSGKSTLAKALSETMGAKVIHLTYRFKDQMFDYHTAALELCLKLSYNQPVILDRWWPSEKIYADALRGGTKWPLGRQLLDRVAIKHAVHYIACVPLNKEVYLERFHKIKAERPEYQGDNRKAHYDAANNNWIEQVYDGYIQWAAINQHRRDFSIYDWMTDGQDMTSFIAATRGRVSLQRVDIPVWWRSDNHDWSRQFAGQAVFPQVLFVGERSNSKWRRRVWPFFEYGNSSTWMTEAVRKGGLTEYETAWVNALAPDGLTTPGLLQNVVEQTQPRHIIALGGKAAAQLTEAGTKDFIKLYHPAYYKRFKHGDDSEIVNTLVNLDR